MVHVISRLVPFTQFLLDILILAICPTDEWTAISKKTDTAIELFVYYFAFHIH